MLGATAGILGLAFLIGAWSCRGPFVLRAPKVATLAGDPARLEATTRFLSQDCVPRSYRTLANLEKAAAFIEAAFRESGDDPRRQEYAVREGTFANVIVTRPGGDPSLPVVVVGAHYDAFGRTPGADDNASGVAVLLELARLTKDVPHRRTHVFAAFSTEEPPFFGTTDMGSARLAEKLKADGTRVTLMVALDLVGFFCDEPGCQPYPFAAMSVVYPSRGDFIAVTGDMSSGAAIALCKRGIASAKSIPVVSFRAPRALGYTDLSDHSSFWDAGFPGVLVTDTDMLRNPRYHGDDDLPATLDFGRMAAVVEGLQGVLQVADE